MWQTTLNLGVFSWRLNTFLSWIPDVLIGHFAVAESIQHFVFRLCPQTYRLGGRLLSFFFLFFFYTDNREGSESNDVVTIWPKLVATLVLCKTISSPIKKTTTKTTTTYPLCDISSSSSSLSFSPSSIPKSFNTRKEIDGTVRESWATCMFGFIMNWNNNPKEPSHLRL